MTRQSRDHAPSKGGRAVGVVGKTNILLFWMMQDWGRYGRAYENVAEQLARQPGVRRVVCVLGPGGEAPPRGFLPIRVFAASRRLMVLTLRPPKAAQTEVSPTAGQVASGNSLPDRLLRALLWALGFRQSNTLLWLYPSHPYIDTLKRITPHRWRVVQIVDNNALLQSASTEYKSAVVEQYERLAREAHCVVVSSTANHQAFSRLNSSCLLFENAVDAAFIRCPTELPCRKSGARPRLGYVGWITERTDLELLEFVARERPQYDVVIAGPKKTRGFKRLLSLPNVTWLGEVPYQRVPDLVTSFDVCLIPHRDTPYSRSMSPLKLFQYLGSGRPIVSTEVAGVERWRGLIAVATKPDDFVECIDTALRVDSEADAAARIEAASAETWERRVRQMYQEVVRACSAH